jgi:TonB family protein
MNILLLAGKVVCCSGILYGYYRLFLQNMKFHRYNRFFLISVIFLSFILPFIQLPVFESSFPEHAMYQSLRMVTWGTFDEKIIDTGYAVLIPATAMLWGLYAAGAGLFLFFLVRSCLYLKTLIGKYPAEKLNDIRFHNTSEPGTPFSFFKSIFWNKAIDPSSVEGQKIFRHELFHIRQFHSLDMVFCEVVTIIAWFNPFFHIIRKELKAIHEFLADEYAAGNDDKMGYAELLVLQSIKLKHQQFVHPFFQNHLKRRILMITQFNKSRYGYLSRIMTLPVAFILFCAISLYAKRAPSGQNDIPVLYANGQPMILMIDAGHGGNDDGAKSADGKYREKDLALAIAKKLRDEAEAAGIKVLMSRESDISLSVQERSTLNERHRPDLFVSLHIGAGPDAVNNSLSGAEAYIGSEKQQTKIPSIELGNSILNALKPVLKINGPVKQRSNAGIWVLDQSICPAVLIHCGFMTNQNDVAFISNPANQKKIATHILSGIQQFKQQQSADNQNNTDTIHTIHSSRTDERDTIPTDPGKLTFTKVEISPAYPGGVNAWITYLKNNLRYPDAAMKKNISGTVVVKFIVDLKGKVVNIEPVTGPEELRSEAIRIIKESGNWLPAIQNGKKVKAYHEQTIVFRLDHT